MWSLRPLGGFYIGAKTRRGQHSSDGFDVVATTIITLISCPEEDMTTLNKPEQTPCLKCVERGTTEAQQCFDGCNFTISTRLCAVLWAVSETKFKFGVFVIMYG